MAAGQPLVTDGGNHIYDCGGFGPISDARSLDRTLSTTVGVVGHGLFLGMATEALIASEAGLRRLVPG
jgi:ribose 5-phosphate isomerase A